LLTDKALYERKWGWIPALGEILGKKEIPWHYFGPTSVSDNRFESARRLMEIMILICENCDEIRAEMTRSHELHEKCLLELHQVAEALEAVGQNFLAQSQKVAELANQARGEVEEEHPQRSKLSLLQRLANVGLGRHHEESEPPTAARTAGPAMPSLPERRPQRSVQQPERDTAD
jgi:hypothetical protein